MRITAFATAALFALCAPAFAQAPSSTANDTAGRVTAPSDGAMAAPATGAMTAPGTPVNGTAGRTNDSTDMAMNCQAMMDKASTMDAPSGSKKTMAMKQMTMAKTAMAAGKEDSCKMHMQKAMTDMM